MARKGKHVSDIRSFARQYTDTAVHTLFGIMTNKECQDSSRVAAAQAILDRGWGKAAQMVAVDHRHDASEAFLAALKGLTAGDKAKVIDQPKALITNDSGD